MQFNIARQFFDGENQQTSQLALLHEPHWVWNSNQHRTSPFKIVVKLSLLQFSSKNTLVLNCPWMKYCGTHWSPLEVKSFPFIFSQKCYSLPNYDQTNLKNFSLQLKEACSKNTHTISLKKHTQMSAVLPNSSMGCLQTFMTTTFTGYILQAKQPPHKDNFEGYILQAKQNAQPQVPKFYDFCGYIWTME